MRTDEPAPELINQRIRDLGTEKELTGLANHLFWSWDGEALPLGDCSVFAPPGATEAELLLSVGSAIQTMRSVGKLDEEFLPPVSKLLREEYWIRGRFYASAITPAILRMVKPHDLISPMPNRALSKAIDTRLTEAASHSVRAEILLAVAARKLPETREVRNLAGSLDHPLCPVVRSLLQDGEDAQLVADPVV